MASRVRSIRNCGISSDYTRCTEKACVFRRYFSSCSYCFFSADSDIMILSNAHLQRVDHTERNEVFLQ